VKVLRTDDSRFENLKDYNFNPNYLEINHEGVSLRMHYLDENSQSDEVVLLLHGEPSWSYLYRKMIPLLVKAGKRVIAPDLIGFGKSDKLSEREDYSYLNHIQWTSSLLTHLKLKNMILFAQDWGGLIGLRLLANAPENFSGLVVSNSGLPVGIGSSEGFNQWLNFSQTVEDFNSGKIVNQGSMSKLNEEEVAAYNAPFPNEDYKAGPRVFPKLVPITTEHPQVKENIEAWEVLKNFDKPTIALFGEHDMAFKEQDKYIIEKIKGAEGMPHRRINAGHFSQENQPEELVEAILSI
tara:strand:+ start:18946 stop:19830 length:885 start_codon:yes stop_codon:yes gene_type:complete